MLVAKRGAGHGFYLTPRPLPVQDPTALRALHDAYAALGAHNTGHPWTAQETLTLGRLHTQAYGRLPHSSRCRPSYSLPDRGTIIRLWGTFALWHHAMQAGITVDPEPE